VGLHASFDSWKDAKFLGQEIKKLRTLTGAEITGCRTHYLNYDEELTPRAENEVGFVYDSTSGFNYGVGFRSGTSFPFRSADFQNAPWELPFQLMDTALRSLRISPAQQERLALQTLQAVREHQGVLILNWHFHTMNEAAFPESVALLRKIIETAKRTAPGSVSPRNRSGLGKTQY